MKHKKVAFVALLSWVGAFQRRMLRAVASYARAQQWELLVSDPATVGELAALDTRVDGIVLSTHPILERRQFTFRCPTVNLITHWENDPCVVVGPDNVAIGRAVAEYFVECGFRRLAFVGDSSGAWWVKQRYQGLAGKAAELGLECLDFGVVEPTMAKPPFKSIARREIAIARWMRKLPPAVGVMACNDFWSRCTVGACRRLNRRIPEEAAVVGVDDDDLHVETCNPPLSSVSHQYDRCGNEACELLTRLMAGAPPPRRPILIPPGQLIVRQSSDTTVTDDPVVASALQFFKRRGSNDVSIKDVLRELCVSRAWLDKRFHQALGRSPAEVLRRAKIDRAKHLLASSELPMPQVASRAGFSCARQLSITFRRETGATPTGYRRRYRLRETTN
jgi:LacI family transcriptional regulator